MRKLYLSVCACLCILFTHAQVSGTKTIGVDYPNIAAAITALNTSGVGAGGATINVPAGYTETAPAGGFLLGSSVLNVSLGSANPLVFQKSGAGANPLLTAPAGTSTTVDGIFKLAGVDYVTIDGIDLQESAANTTATTAMEWGYAFVNLNAAAPFDGCNNNTVKNCTVTLNRTIATPSVAIFFGHVTATSSTALTITAAGDLHSNNKLYSNTLTNTTTGIQMLGYNDVSPYALYDQGNDIGGTSPATGNTITNFGGTNYTSIGGITIVYQNNASVGYNTVNMLANGGVNTIGAHWGIYVFGTNSTFTVNNNAITLGIASINTSYFTYGIYSNAAGTNLTANNNTISQTDPSGSAMPMYGIFFPNGTNFTATTNSVTQTQGISGTTYGIYTTAVGTLNINSNTVQQTTTAAVTSAFASIYCSGTAVTENINSNIFNNTSVNTTGSTYLIYASNSTPVVNVGNNSISGTITRSGTSGTFYGYYNFGTPGSGTATISGNNFSGITLSGSSAFYGIYQATSTSQVEIISNNTITNVTAATGTLIGIHHNYGAANSADFGNIINNISGTGTVTGIQIGNSTASLGMNVYGNTVNTLSTTGASTVSGIIHTNGVATNIYKNKVYDLLANNASGAVSGITVTGGTTVNVFNNLIGDLRTPISNAANPLIGLSITGGTTVNAYFNTVNLNGVSSGALFGSSAVSVSSTPTVTLRNNIFVNNSTPSGATGYAVAYRRSSTTLTTYGSASNNNLFYAGTPGANNLIYYDGTNAYQTLAAYKTMTVPGTLAPRDNVSVTENPPFLGTVGSNANFLHINPAVATQVESGAGAIASVTDDFDGDVRNASTPDIGADEGNFTILDLTGPSISYSALTSTLCTSTRTITASITDASGVNITVGTRPRIWFKKASNANVLPGTNDNTTDGWKYSEASNASSPFSLTIDPALIFGGVSNGDVIQYFIVAQDNAATPNVSINTGTFASAASGVALTAANFPIGGTINSYTIGSGGLSGTVTIGAAGTYPTLTGAGGLFAALNAGGLTGNLTVNILDAAITEPGTNALNAITYGCSGPYTLTIKPGAGVTSTLTGSAGYIIKLNGASNVTIDGSNNGTNSQNLTIVNNQATTSAVIWNAALGGAGNGANNNTFKNLIITGGSGSVSTVVGIANAATGSITTAGDDNNNLTIQNCSISKVLIGIEAIGTATLPQNGLVISGNSIGSATAANYIQFQGIQLSGANSPVISQNTIFNIKTSTLTSATTGIDVGANVIGGQITKNNINGIYNQNTGQWASYGLNFSSGTGTTNVTVSNNFISDIQTVIYLTSTTFNAFGIRVTGGTNLKFYHNTVNLFGNITLASGTGFSSDFLVTSTSVTGMDVRNNIFSNTMTFAATASVYNVYLPSGFTWGTTNYNDYYGTSGTGPTTYYLGYNGSNQAALSNWQTAFSQDAQSKNVTPVFNSNTDLHLQSTPVGTNWCLNSAGVTIPSITTDIDGDTRTSPPDIGADEFNVTGDAVATPASQTVCSGTAITTITYSGTGTTFTWTRDNTGTVTGMAASGSGNIAGTLTNTTLAPVTVTFTITAYNASGCTGATFTATVLVNPSPDAVATPGSQTICSGSAISTIALTSAVPGATYTWTRDNTATVTGIAASGTGDITGSLTNTTGAPVMVTFTITPSANGCTGTPITATVLVNVGPSITPTFTQPTTCVSTDGAISIALSGAAGPYTFAWTGTGVNPTAQNQTGLIAGTYSVTVTAANGCSTFAVYTLVGPGGCSVCPVIGSVTTNPTPSGCIGSPVTLTASGLTAMGITYGINFVSFTAPTANPYTGGTVLATVPNTSLTGGGTTATGTGTFAAANTYYIYAVLTPTPLDPSCRPSAVTTFVINPTPDAAATPASQTVCSGSAITAIAFSGTVSGTTYDWTRDNTASVTGIAASGSGNITGTLTNTTSAPVTVTFTITPTANGCSGTPITATVLVNPTPTATATPSSQSICSGTAITTIALSGSAVTGTTYNWTRDNTATVTGIAASGSGNISGTLTNTTGAAITVTFTVTPVANGCSGTPVTATVVVNPTATGTATPASQTVCSGATITTIALSGVSGSTFTWTRNNVATVPGGIPASGSGSSISGFLINTTNAPVTVTFTITPTANGCTGTPFTATVTVNPFASATATPATQTVCSGYAINIIALTSNVTGATFSWTRDNTATLTGIAASGTGNSIAGTLVNTTAAAVTTTFTITPSFGGCSGPSITALVTVNPTPVVTQPGNQTVCNGSTTSTVTFASTLTGTTYTWTNTTPSIGLAASGTGNLPAFTAVNTGTTPVTATITVTPTTGSCSGTPKTFTITVNPTATVNSVSNQTLCTGATTTAISFSGAVTGTTFSWTNNTPSIGLAASGTGNIAAFTAVNTTSTAVTATITVTPSAAGCTGTPTTFTITVNGNSVAPTGATASSPAVCGSGTVNLSVTGGALGTGASWKWYTGSCGGTLVGTGATISTSVSGTTTFYVRAEGTCNTTTCASVTVTVNPQPTISISAAPYTSLKPGLSTTITATISPSSATNTIVWYKNGAVLSGQSTNTLSNITVDQLGTYSASVTTAAGCSATSGNVVIKDSASDRLYVLPNPTDGQFKLRYYTNATSFGFKRNVIVYDSKGAMVYSKEFTVTAPYSSMDVDIRKMGRGLYLVLVTDFNGKQLTTARVDVIQ
ncbi:MAG: hypothetical protein JST86_07855 [Bacteroidetes bacterium]|nr:hypothetical protein [Bacteroidota bacterium]